MLAVVFDTETNGLISNHSIKLEKQPSIIEFYGCLADLSTGEIKSELDQLIKPPAPLLEVVAPGERRTITEITGITNEMLNDKPKFSLVAPQIAQFIEQAPAVIAHNASFDREMVDIEFERLGQHLVWPRVICAVEATIHLKGFRLSLTALHEHLFGVPFAGAHRAKQDVAALLKCCVKLYEDGAL